MSVTGAPLPRHPQLVGGLNLDGWRGGLRRTLVRLFSQGPRRLAPVSAFHAPLLHEAGERFLAPSAGPVQPDWPSHAASWQLAPQIAPNRKLYLAAESGLYDDDGVVYDLSSRTAFSETLNYWQLPPARHPALAIPRVSSARRLEGLSLFMGGLGGQTFYHFLIDHLPQLALLRTCYPEAKRIIVQAYIEEPKLAWLRQAGCTLPVEWLHPLDHLRCERLAFTSRVTSPYNGTPWSIARLRQLVGCHTEPTGGPRRFIWADRRSSNARSTSWENDIITGLPDPWEAVDFGKLTPKEVMATMADCACFAGFHGAAFANLALAPSKVRVLEILREPNYAWYPALSCLCGHDHRVLFAGGAYMAPTIHAALVNLV